MWSNMAGEHENSCTEFDDTTREHGRDGGVLGHQSHIHIARAEVYTNTIDGCVWLALGAGWRTAESG